MGRFGRLAVVAAMGLVGAGALAIALSGGASALQTCTDSWQNAAGGQWGTAANWSTGLVPTSTDDVCIGDTTGGTYTVVLNGSFSAHSITVGGTLTGTQTLDVQGAAPGNGILSLGAGTSAIKANGAATLDSANGNHAELIGSNAITNNGSLTTVQGAGGVRFIEVPLTNASTGTVTIAATDTRLDNNTLTTNSGAFTVTSGATLALTSGSSFTNSAGTLTVAGSFNESGGTFTESGGNVAGANPAVIQSAVMVDSAGTGAFLLEASDTLSGSIPVGQTVTVLGSGPGNANTTLSGTVTNNGTLLLDSSNGNYALIGTGSLDNKGLLKTIQDAGGQRYFDGAITNESGATIEIASADTRQDVNTLTTNKGTFKVDSGAGIVLSAGSSFTNSAGTLQVNGAFSEIGGTFTQSGGTETGTNPALIQSAAMVDSAGTGSFLLEATNTVSGTIPTGQTVNVLGSGPGNAAMVVAGTLVNKGTLLLDTTNGNFAALETGTAGALDNKGTVKTIEDLHGIRYFEVNITNESGATIEIASADTRVDTNNTIVNNGTFTVDSTFGIALTSGSSFTDNTGATLTVNGAFTEVGGTFTQAGGTESGNPAVLQSAAIVDSAGTGSFTFQAGVTLSGTIPSGQTVTVLGAAPGNSSTTLSGTVTNNGTLVFNSNNGNWALITGSGTLDNNGMVKTLQGSGGQRYFEAAVINEPSGTIEIASADTRQDSNTLTTNKGSFTVDSGAAFKLSAGSSFTNSAGTLTANGNFTEVGGTFTESGGNEAGTNPALIQSASLVDSAGTGSFTLEAGVALSGTIPSGQTVTALGAAPGNATITLTGGPVVNSGAFVLDSSNGNYALINGGTLDNKGTLTTIQDVGGQRYFEAPITNEAGATIQINAADTRQDAGTVTANSGTLALGDGAQLKLSGGSSITETSSAITGATINGTTNVTSMITGGTIGIAGTFQVTTVGSPALGNTYQPINTTALSGTFSTLKYGTADYDTSYSASAVTLVVGKPFVLTGKNVTAAEDTPATKVVVAKWTDDDQPANEPYTATINWGDASQSTGTATSTATGGSVKGTHTWATPGTYTITTTVTDSEGTTLVATSHATVHAAGLPVVSSVSPPTVVQGGSVNLVVNGTGFTADSAASFSASGITVDSVTFVTSTQLKVAIDVATNAATGAGNVSVTTDGGTGTCTGCLTVDALPKITGAAPSLPPGSTTTVTVTGSGFQAGLTVTTNIPGATVGAPGSVTATSFTVAITVPAGTTAGTYKLTVSNPDGGKASKNCLVVT